MIEFAPDRRGFLGVVVCAATGSSVSFSALGQDTPIKATKLARDLALIEGNGGNVAVIISRDGLMLIDGGFPDRAAELQKAIAELDSQPVRVLFNTHWHSDHIGLNETLGKAGVKIVAHENTRKWLSQTVTLEALGRTFDPLNPVGLPGETFSNAGKMTFGKEKVEYTPVPVAHTDSDAFVFLPGPNVLHTGDLMFHSFYPVIDYSTHGWVGGMAEAADMMLQACDASTRIIPGHGPLATRDDLKLTRDMLQTVSTRLEAMARQGKTIDEVVDAAPTKDFDAKFGKGVFQPQQWVKIAYTSVLRHNQSV